MSKAQAKAKAETQPSVTQPSDPKHSVELVEGTPRGFTRGTREFTVHTFDLGPATYIKNNSWKLGDLSRLTSIVHKHKYHSTSDRSGKPQIYSTPALNHFHEITVDWSQKVLYKIENEIGEFYEIEGPLLICGPAITFKKKTLSSGKILKKIVPITHEADPELVEMGEAKDVIDTHTHAALYLGQEIMTFEGRGAARKANQQAIAGASDGPVSTQFVESERVRTSAGEIPKDIKVTETTRGTDELKTSDEK